jgi:hypothetical protein
MLSLMLAFALSTAIQFRASASDHTRWNDTVSVEDAMVQACAGFTVTGSYTADRAIQVVENYDGSQFYERRDVTFTGALGNATSGKSYAYDGQYTRIASPALGKAVVSNLSLRFEVDTPGEFSVSLKHVEFDLADDPHAVVKAIVPNVLQMDLCQLFGGSTIGAVPALPQWAYVYIEHPASAGSTIKTTQDFARDVRSKALEEDADANVSDDMTPWTELDPCDSSPPGKPC